MTYHHRGFTGTYVWDDEENRYNCEFVSEDGQDHIYTYAYSSLGCLIDWVQTVNFHLDGGEEEE